MQSLHNRNGRKNKSRNEANQGAARNNKYRTDRIQAWTNYDRCRFAGSTLVNPMNFNSTIRSIVRKKDKQGGNNALGS